jgi:hypothetical protein
MILCNNYQDIDFLVLQEFREIRELQVSLEQQAKTVPKDPSGLKERKVHQEKRQLLPLE